MRELLFVRGALEGAVAAQAAQRFDDEARADLAANLAEAEAAADAGDRTRFYGLDIGFHALLTQHLGMHRAEEILDGVRERLERPRRLAIAPPGRMKATIAQHRAIYENIVAGNAEGARAAMADHLAAVVALFDTLAREKPAQFAL